MLSFVAGLMSLLATSDPASCASLTRENLVSCVSRSNLELVEREALVRAANAKIVAATPLLPTNPLIAFSVARRDGSGPDANRSATNLYGTLSQEIEIAGQRGKRIESATHARDAEMRRSEATRRDVLARAWRAYFTAIAANERTGLAEHLDKSASDVAAIVDAQAKKGLLAPIAAQVADASAVQMYRLRLAVEKERRLAVAELALLLGRDPLSEIVAVGGDLRPLAGSAHITVSETRVDALPQVAALEAEGRSLNARTSLLKRLRAPNPTLSFTIQNDGFNERVIGGGIQLPIPLPWPLGRTNAGDIAELEALTARADVERQLLLRRQKLALIEASTNYETSRAAILRFGPEAIVAAQQSLDNLGDAIATGRMAVNEAIVSRQTLIEYLQAHVDTKLAHALASIDLVLAAGASLEGDGQ